MKEKNAFQSKWLICVLFIFLMMGCAMGEQKWANQSFSFNTSTESKDIDILDWQYGEHGYVGNEHQSLPRAPKEDVAKGVAIGGGGLSGGMPVGDFLYVKWRVKTTGEIHEDKVDLKNKLPKDMNNHRIHFVVKPMQLYIYIYPPQQVKDIFGNIERFASGDIIYIAGSPADPWDGVPVYYSINDVQVSPELFGHPNENGVVKRHLGRPEFPMKPLDFIERPYNVLHQIYPEINK